MIILTNREYPLIPYKLYVLVMRVKGTDYYSDLGMI